MAETMQVKIDPDWAPTYHGLVRALKVIDSPAADGESWRDHAKNLANNLKIAIEQIACLRMRDRMNTQLLGELNGFRCARCNDVVQPSPLLREPRCPKCGTMLTPMVVYTMGIRVAIAKTEGRDEGLEAAAKVIEGECDDSCGNTCHHRIVADFIRSRKTQVLVTSP